MCVRIACGQSRSVERTPEINESSDPEPDCAARGSCSVPRCQLVPSVLVRPNRDRVRVFSEGEKPISLREHDHQLLILKGGRAARAAARVK